MAIRTPNEPNGAREAITRAIPPLFAGGTGTGPLPPIEGDAGAALESAAPHPVFVVGLHTVAQGRLLTGARQLGWRYLLLQGENAVATITLQRDAETEEFVFSHLTRGPYVAATVEGIDVAEHRPEIEEDDFELRLLDVPAVSLRTIWLHGETADLLIPLAPAPAPIEAHRVYREEELLDSLRRLAGRWTGRADDAGG